jgi:hypothetical protein
MIAGLPITGVGGVFYLLLALAMPIVELWRLLRGRSSVAAWRVIGRQLLMQTGVLVTISAQAGLVMWLAPGPARAAAEKSNAVLGMTGVEAVSQSQTAGLIAASTLVALATLAGVTLFAYAMKVYFHLRGSVLPRALA